MKNVVAVMGLVAMLAGIAGCGGGGGDQEQFELLVSAREEASAREVPVLLDFYTDW